MSSQCPKKKVHAVEESTQSEATSMFGSGSEVTLEPTGAGEKICYMGAPNVREGESVDIEIGSRC